MIRWPKVATKNRKNSRKILFGVRFWVVCSGSQYKYGVAIWRTPLKKMSHSKVTETQRFFVLGHFFFFTLMKT